MKRRVALIAALLTLSMSSASFGGILHDLLSPILHPRKKTTKAASSSHASEVVWSGLIIAENAEKPQATPAELARFEQTLKELFGYNQFEIIGQSRKTLNTGKEDWLASSKHFALHVDNKGPSEGGYVVNLKLVQQDDGQPENKQVLLETDTRLSKRSPLVIKGPQVGSGQLLLVLVVQ
jgi:hypothetical protein